MSVTLVICLLGGAAALVVAGFFAGDRYGTKDTERRWAEAVARADDARATAERQRKAERSRVSCACENLPNWENLRHASAYDPVLHRFAHLESLGALNREEAAIGAALALAEQVKEMTRREAERLSIRSHLREKGYQP